MSLPSRHDRGQALARTYGGDRDGRERVEEFQRARRYTADHPEAGSTAAASVLNRLSDGA